MAVDMKALKAVSQGNPADKITVNRAWLAEVHRLLAHKDLGERLADIGDKLMGLGR